MYIHIINILSLETTTLIQFYDFIIIIYFIYSRVGEGKRKPNICISGEYDDPNFNSDEEWMQVLWGVRNILSDLCQKKKEIS
jgi:hypothetical protein